MRTLIPLLLVLLLGCKAAPKIVLVDQNPRREIVEHALASPVLAAVINPGVPVTVSWTASWGTNTAGYKLWWGPAFKTFTNSIDAGLNLSATVTNLIRGGKYYFAATSYHPDGIDSDFGGTLIYTVPPIYTTNTIIRLTVYGQWSSVPQGPFTNYPTPIYDSTNVAGMKYFRTLSVFTNYTVIQ